MRETLHINYDGNSLSFQEEDCYESRGKSTIILVKSAFETLSEEKRKMLKPFAAFFHLGDKSFYPLSLGSSKYNSRTIPCWTFDSWKECGISDYENVCSELIARGKTPPKHDCLFWIGNANTHPTRKLFLQISSNRPDVCAADSGNWFGKDGEMKNAEKKYVSIPEHADYKYLIDIQGNGYSARGKLLMHSGRPLFYQDRQWHEYWFFSTKPFVHYIPLKEDFSDLNEKLNWANTHPKECATIATNALQFAVANLRRANAIQRYQDILMMLGAD
jgi:hypothetical protein